jgi:hypothetical protein
VSGSAWQKAWTAPSVLGENAAFDTNSTPEVPIDTKAAPGVTTPTPQAAAALSPPPPATTQRPATPHFALSSARNSPEDWLPSTSRGIWARLRPVASSRSSDQSRFATSSQSVPELSDISETWWPVRRRRT